jgi:hypothetical protein
MLAFLLTLAVAARLAIGCPQVYGTHGNVNPACTVNQDPQGGCAG